MLKGTETAIQNAQRAERSYGDLVAKAGEPFEVDEELAALSQQVRGLFDKFSSLAEEPEHAEESSSTVDVVVDPVDAAPAPVPPTRHWDHPS